MATRFGSRFRVDTSTKDWMRVPQVIVEGAASDVTSGGWRTVTWNSSGSLTVIDTTIDVEYLVVGGGGGSGSTRTGTPYSRAGGGGAGGDVVSNVGSAKLTLGHGIYDAVVGAGGTGELSSGTLSTIGGASQFADIFAIGGGGGGGRGRQGLPGANSGGHGGDLNTVMKRCLLGGFDGGDSGYSDSFGNGGAGDSANGVDASASGAGAGGSGTANTITGSSVTYGGGGGGGSGTSNATVGAGGAGGGAAGKFAGAGNPGTANTGGGAGGAGSNGSTATAYDGAAGGSGIVIVRWAA